jgi:hypothetical protein
MHANCFFCFYLSSSLWKTVRKFKKELIKIPKNSVMFVTIASRRAKRNAQLCQSLLLYYYTYTQIRASHDKIIYKSAPTMNSCHIHSLLSSPQCGCNSACGGELASMIYSTINHAQELFKIQACFCKAS